MVDGRKATIISVLIAVPLIIGGMLMMNNYRIDFNPLSPPDTLTPSPALQAEIDELFLGFVRDMGEDMKAYTKERKILVEAVSAFNLRDPAFIEENHQMVEALVPSLRERMKHAMERFIITETKVNELLIDQPAAIADEILAKWDALRLEQGRLYEAYFASETDLLTAYQELMGFYYQKRGTFTVDPATFVMTFQDPADQAAADGLKKKINELIAAQKKMLAETDKKKS